MSETKAAKAALLKQKQEQNVERARVEQAKQEQERLERERKEQAQKAQYKQEQEQREKERLEQEQLKQAQQLVKKMMEEERAKARIEKINNAITNFNTLESFQIIYKETQNNEAPQNKYERWQTDDVWRESMILEAIEIVGAIKYDEVAS